MTSIQARNRRNGSKFEIDLRTLFREHGFKAERLHLEGKNDEGDLTVEHAPDDIDVVEAKTGAFTPAMWEEAVREAAQYAKARGLQPEDVNPVVIKKNPGKSIRKAFVITTVENYYGLDS